MRLVSYNIQYSKGKDGTFDLARIARAIEGADVICLQEVERGWKRSGRQDQPAELARMLPGYHWVYGPGADMAMTGAPPGAMRRQFGNMLLSKTPILAARNHMLPKFGSLTQYSLQRCALEGVIATPFGPVRFYSIHLTHVDDASRLPQVEAILDIHRRAPGEGGAWCGTHREEAWTEGEAPPPMPREAILMGDFNFPPTSPLYERFVGPMSEEYGRCNHIEGFVDAWVAAGNREGGGVTCIDDRGIAKRIDYCFVSTALVGRIRRAWIDSDAAGSDHQPIWTEFG